MNEPTMTEEAAKTLRSPFPPEQIGKLPRGNIKLDYVGHAAVTDRLLSVDPFWSWEPVAFTDNGTPYINVRGDNAVLWIRLTICGVTRLGVGIVATNAPETEKQLIGDAIRNAAMRFGVALDLWSKEDLSGDSDPHRYDQTARDQGPLRGPEPEPTPAGNQRRGPRVMDGWRDAVEQREQHDAFTEYLKGQTDSVQIALKAWKEEKKYGWPMTADQLAETIAEMHTIARQEAEEI